MLPFTDFKGKDNQFWAYVKLISERLGYSDRGSGGLRRYTFEQMFNLLSELKLDISIIFNEKEQKPTKFAQDIITYLNMRSEVLEKEVSLYLMNREEARLEFERIKNNVKPRCYLPMNKQKKEKRHYSYLVGITNMLTEESLGGCYFDDNPKGLVIIKKNEVLVRTFSRWMDGAYPSRVNPIAVWEIKEYYGTTTFGSRVADGIYETMLDGYELIDLKNSEGRKIKHYLIIDDKFTWWIKGKSYLCRIIDLLNSGFIDEAIFGKEIIKRWPEIVKSWGKLVS